MIQMIARSARLASVILALYWVTLFIATHAPLPFGLPKGRHLDKVAHGMAYAGLAFLLTWSLATRAGVSRRTQIQVLCVVAAYGAIDELLQTLIPYRHGDVLDWLADVAGAVLGMSSFLALHALYRATFRRRSLALEQVSHNEAAA